MYPKRIIQVVKFHKKILKRKNTNDEAIKNFREVSFWRGGLNIFICQRG